MYEDFEFLNSFYFNIFTKFSEKTQIDSESFK